MTGLINRPVARVTFHFRHVAKLPFSARHSLAPAGGDSLDARALARNSSTNNKNRFGRNALWGFT
jgi:hypothetical protein